MDLPIAQTIDALGITFRVRAIPWGLARRAANGADLDTLAAEIYDRLVTVDAPAEKPPLDDLPVDLVERIIGASSARDANPTQPPPPSR